MIVTPETIVTALPAAKPGDTLELVGAFTTIPLKYRPANLTLDCTKATITGDSRTTDVDGLTVIGGKWTGANPLNIARGRNIKIVDAVMEGPEARLGNALGFMNVTGLTISGLSLKSYKNGIGLGYIDGFEIGNVELTGMRADAIQAAPVWNGKFHHLAVHGTRPSEDVHADGLQLRSLVGQKPTGNIVIEDCMFMGPIQGVATTAHNDDPGFDNLTLRRVRTCVGMPNGIGVVRTRGLTIEDCHVWTLPGSPYLSKIFVEPTCTDVTWPGLCSDFAPYRNKRGWVSA